MLIMLKFLSVWYFINIPNIYIIHLQFLLTQTTNTLLICIERQEKEKKNENKKGHNAENNCRDHYHGYGLELYYVMSRSSFTGRREDWILQSGFIKQSNTLTSQYTYCIEIIYIQESLYYQGMHHKTMSIHAAICKNVHLFFQFCIYNQLWI